MQLIQILPGLPPPTDGIGDYALKLARQFRDEHAIETMFLVVAPDWNGAPVNGFEAISVRERTADALEASIRRIEKRAGAGLLPILVHFSVYGYQKRGCPFWFATGLERLHQQRRGSISIAFHELENHGWKPWSSTFWLPRIQRSLLMRIARVGSFRYTNADLNRQKLEHWGAGPVALIPNFSGLGEPSQSPPFAHRQNDLVIFGRPEQRKSTYARAGHILSPLCRQIGITRILDIGSPVPETCIPQVTGVEIVCSGWVSEEQINGHMARAVGSFMQYPVPLLTKSSAHAAACASGAIPFVYDNARGQRSCPPLVSGEDFIRLQDDLSGLDLPPLEALSRRVFENYQTRNSRVAAGVIARHLFKL
jgi:hypothetical protein